MALYRTFTLAQGISIGALVAILNTDYIIISMDSFESVASANRSKEEIPPPKFSISSESSSGSEQSQLLLAEGPS